MGPSWMIRYGGRRWWPQEVDKHWSSRSGFVDQAAVLGGKLGMQVRFAPIYSLDPLEPDGPRREYGLAILSRYPITFFKNHELSRISFQEPEKGVQKLPGFPEAVINLHGQKMHLFNTHLSWLDPELRLQEANEMLEIMASARYQTDHRRWFCIDSHFVGPVRGKSFLHRGCLAQFHDWCRY